MDDLTPVFSRAKTGGEIQERGSSQSAGELLELVYQKLREVAAQKIAREAPGYTLQPTALVHEAWLRVAPQDGSGGTQWESRWHFFSAAAEAMRRILIDRARSKRAIRHGGALQRVDIEHLEIMAPVPDTELIDVHESLDALAKQYPEKAEVVKLRYFAGLTIPETAELLGISHATAERYWTSARVWLFRYIAHRNGAQ